MLCNYDIRDKKFKRWLKISNGVYEFFKTFLGSNKTKS